MESKVTPETRDAPIYQTFSELFVKGFTLDTTTWVFVLAIHVAAVGLGVWVGFAASQEWALVAFAWASVHFVVGSLSMDNEPTTKCTEAQANATNAHSWDAANPTHTPSPTAAT